MELCPGGDLQQLLLKEGCPGLQLDRTRKLTAEVALALEHLHSRRIVFRDLKLENVVVSAEGHGTVHVKLLPSQVPHTLKRSAQDRPIEACSDRG
eukprot:2401534-Amphidinium_carterae.1